VVVLEVEVEEAEGIVEDAVEDLAGDAEVVLVGEGEHEVVVFKNAGVPLEAEVAQAVAAVEDVEDSEEVQKLSSNPIGTLVFSSQKPRRACW